ncbi:DUF6261 family protein [Aquimarina hainanensis]|uniref:DUF6261 family protein n=1 Tax=Aquimarina hainanensis TaxID=1578017 RepID=A0ABW5N4C4_9FLAO|nr:DUF6261 family protein [Aquimarina sp. TRL1]QKX04920.1 hypothetical protein HN014_08300 [Aquimarina sp. TRL1]
MNSPYLHRYRNGEYLQYMKDILELVNEQDTNALQLTNYVNNLLPLIDKIEIAFLKSQGNGLTKDILALDERRDRAIVGLRGLTDSYKYHFDKKISKAATALHDNIILHGNNIQRMSFQEETTVLNSIITDWEREEDLIAAVQVLKLGDWLSDLKSTNIDFSTKYIDRVGSAAVNSSSNISKLREKATNAYKHLVSRIHAGSTLAISPEYDILLDQMNILAGQYNFVVDNRTGLKKKSTNPSTES